jgi:hypothetical protein
MNSNFGSPKHFTHRRFSVSPVVADSPTNHVRRHSEAFLDVERQLASPKQQNGSSSTELMSSKSGLKRSNSIKERSTVMQSPMKASDVAMTFHEASQSFSIGSPNISHLSNASLYNTPGTPGIGSPALKYVHQRKDSYVSASDISDAPLSPLFIPSPTIPTIALAFANSDIGFSQADLVDVTDFDFRSLINLDDLFGEIEVLKESINKEIQSLFLLWGYTEKNKLVKGNLLSRSWPPSVFRKK